MWLWLNAYQAVTGSWNDVMVKANGSQSYYCYIGNTFDANNEGPYIWIGHATAPATAQAVNGTLALNTWTHFALTFDSTANPSCRIYKNGIEVSYQTQLQGSGARTSDAAMNLRIGSEDITAHEWNGRIAEACIFNAVLTADEAKMLMHGFLPRPNTMRGCWPLFGTVSPEPDWSGNNGHGTLTGTLQIDHPPQVSAYRRSSPMRVTRVPAEGVPNSLLLMGVGV